MFETNVIDYNTSTLLRGGSFLSPDTRSECFLRGVKFLAENLRGMKFSPKIMRGLKISPFQEE